MKRPTGPLGAPYTQITIAVLALVTIVAFEAMAVSTAMPTIARELNAVRSYGLAFSVMLTAQLLGIVLAGVWTDRSGPLPGTFAGQALTAVGCGICGTATRWDVFIVGRTLLGLGGGLLVVMLYVIAGRVYPEVIRPRLFTLVSAAWVLPSLLGPPIAAWIASESTWRLIFWVVVVPVVLTMVGIAKARHRVSGTDLTARVSNRDHSTHVRIAWAGLAIAVAAGLVQYGTANFELRLDHNLVLSVIGLVGVVLVAPRLVPPGTWRMAPGVPSVMLARFLLTAAFYGGVTYVPLFLHEQRGASLQVAGLALAVGSLGWAFGAWYQAHDKHHANRAWLIELGAVFLTVGMGVLAAVAALNLRGGLSVIALVLGGLAMGLGVTTTTVVALEMTPLADQAEASSSLQLADVLGSVVGIAGATAFFGAWHVPKHDNDLFGAIFFALALVAALGVLAGRRVGPGGRSVGEDVPGRGAEPPPAA